MVVVRTGSYVDVSRFWLLEETLDSWSMFLTGKVALGFHPDGEGLKMGVTASPQLHESVHNWALCWVL